MIAVITGGTGFVGQHLVRALIQIGATVRIITSRSHSKIPLLNLGDRIRWYGMDDYEIGCAIQDATHFFNFAVLYDRPIISDAHIKAVNIDLPLKILARLRQAGAPATCIFGDTFFRRFSPDATSQRRYTNSKIALAGKLDEIYKSSDMGGVRSALMQIEHVYGPGDSFSKFIPFITRQMIEGNPRISLTNGEQQRDFIHVDDVIEAILLISKGQWSGFKLVECGTGVAIKVRKLVELQKILTSSKSILGFGDLPADQKIEISSANPTWLRAKDWRPRVTLEMGLLDLAEDVTRRLSD